jgi:DNA-binding XRE family transcriptional regulator
MNSSSLRVRSPSEVGFTQARLAAVAGTTQSVISAVESGTRVVSADFLTRVLVAARMRPSLTLARYAWTVWTTCGSCAGCRGR